MRTMLRAPCTVFTSLLAHHRYTPDRSLTSTASRLKFSPQVPGVSKGFPVLQFCPGDAIPRSSFAAMAFHKIKVDNPIVEMDGRMIVWFEEGILIGRRTEVVASSCRESVFGIQKEWN